MDGGTAGIAVTDRQAGAGTALCPTACQGKTGGVFKKRRSTNK
jgi:hypothetical protein